MNAPIVTPVPAPGTVISRVVSNKGIEAWLVSDYTVPVVAMTFAFKGGAAQDEPGAPGRARFAAGLLDEGAGPLDARAFHEALDDDAIELSFDAGRETIGGSMRTLAANCDAAFDLLRLALNEPRFDEDAVERVRAQILAGLRHDSTEPNAIAGRVFTEKAFPDHPYGRPVRGTSDSIAALGRATLRDGMRAAMGRDALHVAVVGAIDAGTLAEALDRVFGDLPEKSVRMPIPDVVAANIGTRHVVDLDISQSVVRFGAPGLDRHDPDYMGSVVINHVLGGGVFQSRLFREVRDKRGLAYSVSSGLQNLDHAAMIVGGTTTKNERALEALEVIEEQIASLVADGPGEEELDKAKKYLIGSYALRFDTSSKIAGQLLQISLEGLGIDYMSRRNGLIDTLDMADVRRAGSRLLRDGKLLVAMVGRPVGV